jgi:hypothetical protein
MCAKRACRQELYITETARTLDVGAIDRQPAGAMTVPVNPCVSSGAALPRAPSETLTEIAQDVQCLRR